MELVAAMELLQAINGRRSVREYSAEPVDDALVRELIDAAVQAPSAINKQPWCFIVVKRSKLLAEISDKAKAHMLKSLSTRRSISSAIC
jgi:nitroreductase